MAATSAVTVLESPEKKLARSRLGNLLQGIRDTETNVQKPKRRGLNSPDVGSSESGHEGMEQDPNSHDLPLFVAPKRELLKSEIVKPLFPARRPRKEKKVVFELRGKPFELNDYQSEQSLYRLCRTWMKGKETELEANKSPTEPPHPPTEDSLDLLATKEIHCLPRPKDPDPDMTALPVHEAMEHPLETLDLTSRQSILGSYTPHWKQVKKRWIKHTRDKESRYAKSFCLLQTVYNISQQNQFTAP